MSPLRAWLAAIRPRTLGLAVSPVVLGTALAVHDGAAFRPGVFLATLAAALLIQIGTNLHNDAADFERGTDGPERLGPPRAVASGWLSAWAVLRGAWGAFLFAFLLGCYLVAVGGWPIVGLGLASLAAGVAYSAGPRPLSGLPLGEIFVVLFFGLVAVAGSYELQAGGFSATAWLAGLVPGLPAAGVLLVNNHRDREGDRRSGRRTLAGMLPPAAVVWLYGAMLVTAVGTAPFLFEHRVLALPVLLMLVPAFDLVAALRRSSGRSLNAVLARTAGFQLALGGLTALCLLVDKVA